MKTILMATDYSREADNALQYAIGLAKALKAKLLLFHAYTIPLPSTDPAIVPVSMKEFEADNLKAIKNLERKTLKQASGKIKVESFISPGFPVQETLNIIKKKKPDLVVTGIKGGGTISETLIGSTATSLMKMTNVPVLAIPLESKFRKAKKIVLAYDYKKTIKQNVLKRIKELVNLFKAKVLVLNVVKLEEDPQYSKASTLVKLKGALKGVQHSFFFPVSENIVDEINEFVDQQKADLLVMIPHKHSGLEKLFHPSNTKHMAFHTHIPLLSIHD